MLKDVDKSIWKYLIFSAFLLLPTLAFPISSDLSVFMHGGMVIADGGSLFKDFFDIKPPLIYYIFAGINKALGDHVLAFRGFDFVYQLLFLGLSIVLFTRMKVESRIIKIYLLIFPISYTVLNYRDILQTESLAFIPLLIYFYFVFKKEVGFKSVILMGISLGVVISLKYTLGIVFIVSIMVFIQSFGFNYKSITRIGTQLLIAVFILFLTFLPTLLSGNLNGLIDTNKYLAEYASYPPVSLGLAKTMLQTLYDFFGNLLSVSSLFLFVLCAVKVKKGKYLDLKRNLLIFCLLLFCSVILERKINMYHLIRFYPFFILMVSMGLVYFIDNFKLKINVQSAIFIIVFLVLSPLPRLVNSYKISYERIIDYDSYVSYYTKENTFNLLRNHIILADYINSKEDSKFLLMNTGGNQTIHYLDFQYKYKFPHSAFHLSPKAPLSYKSAFEEDLHDANIIAIDNSDDIYMIFLSNGSSYDLFFADTNYRNYLNENFNLDTILLDRYYIYIRKEKK